MAITEPVFFANIVYFFDIWLINKRFVDKLANDVGIALKKYLLNEKKSLCFIKNNSYLSKNTVFFKTPNLFFPIS